MSDNDWFLKRRQAEKAERAEAIERTRKAAHAQGKEPFDLAKLEAEYDTNPDVGSPPPAEERERVWAEKYYVQYPDVMTVKEFAALMNELEPYR